MKYIITESKMFDVFSKYIEKSQSVYKLPVDTIEERI